MLNRVEGVYIIKLPPELYACIERFAKFKRLSVEEAACYALKKFLEHQSFYEIAKHDLSYYLRNQRMVKVIRFLSLGSGSLGQIARAVGIDYGRARSLIEKLQAAGIVLVSRFGKRGYWITLNHSSPITQKLLEILNSWYEK
ncbi:winged helix-turn-helix transcriptional regulator [Candidatus Bathyarchaeota archaeon]|nr:winged helix-turn-helix transcriptional regulator [Candidatus Bathyarchaeota archaeon]